MTSFTRDKFTCYFEKLSKNENWNADNTDATDILSF